MERTTRNSQEEVRECPCVRTWVESSVLHEETRRENISGQAGVQVAAVQGEAAASSQTLSLQCWRGGPTWSAHMREFLKYQAFRLLYEQPEEGAREGVTRENFGGGSSRGRQHCFG